MRLGELLAPSDDEWVDALGVALAPDEDDAVDMYREGARWIGELREARRE